MDHKKNNSNDTIFYDGMEEEEEEQERKHKKRSATSGQKHRPKHERGDVAAKWRLKRARHTSKSQKDNRESSDLESTLTEFDTRQFQPNSLGTFNIAYDIQNALSGIVLDDAQDDANILDNIARGSERTKKSEYNTVHLRNQQRNGRKSITIVEGISEEFDLERITKTLRKRLCCIGKLINDAKNGKVIQLSGDQREKVSAFLTREKICRPDQIKMHGF